MASMTLGSVITETIFISDPNAAHRSGSTSKMRLSSRAQLAREGVDGSRRLSVALDRARSDLVDRDDARVVERRCGFRFDDEAPKPLLVVDEPRRKDLERNASLQGEILGEVHLSHAAGSQRAHDSVVGDDVACCESVVHGGGILTACRGSWLE